jgi:hypothetical protein
LKKKRKVILERKKKEKGESWKKNEKMQKKKRKKKERNALHTVDYCCNPQCIWVWGNSDFPTPFSCMYNIIVLYSSF